MKTISVSDDFHKMWCKTKKVKKLRSVQLSDEFMSVIRNKQQQWFFAHLPKTDKRGKVLNNKKIDKKYRKKRC